MPPRTSASGEESSESSESSEVIGGVRLTLPSTKQLVEVGPFTTPVDTLANTDEDFVVPFRTPSPQQRTTSENADWWNTANMNRVEGSGSRGSTEPSIQRSSLFTLSQEEGSGLQEGISVKLPTASTTEATHQLSTDAEDDLNTLTDGLDQLLTLNTEGGGSPGNLAGSTGETESLAFSIERAT